MFLNHFARGCKLVGPPEAVTQICGDNIKTPKKWTSATIALMSVFVGPIALIFFLFFAWLFYKLMKSLLRRLVRKAKASWRKWRGIEDKTEGEPAAQEVEMVEMPPRERLPEDAWVCQHEEAMAVVEEEIGGVVEQSMAVEDVQEVRVMACGCVVPKQGENVETIDVKEA